MNADLGMDICMHASAFLFLIVVVLIPVFTTFHSYSLPAILTWSSFSILKALSLCTIMLQTKFSIMRSNKAQNCSYRLYTL